MSTFQKQKAQLQMPFPYKGINLTSNNEPASAKYLQNIILGNNNTGKVRFGTNLESSFEFNEDVIYRNIIHGSSFLKTDGTYENLVYTTYLSVIPFIDMVENIEVAININDVDSSLITIDLAALDGVHKLTLKSKIYEGSYIQVTQLGVIDGADITNVVYTDDTMSFNIPFSPDFFELDAHGHNMFSLWYERAGIFRIDGDTFEVPALISDLDPNVIVCSINYQNTLLFANGVDPVQAYDGDTIRSLSGFVSVPTTGEITTVGGGNNISFNIKESSLVILQEVLVANLVITLQTEVEDLNFVITNIEFADPVDEAVLVTITCDNVPPEQITAILYEKIVPAFSYIAVGHNRLWALAEGRDYHERFRSPTLSQRVYFAAKAQSVTDWFDQKTNEIGYIDLSKNTDKPDNTEVIWFFQGKMLFIGRTSSQLWMGDDPTKTNYLDVNDDGNFKFEKSFPFGIMQKTLCQELPNNLVIISDFGQSYSFHLNQYGNIIEVENFIDPVKDCFEGQLAFINTDREYRDMMSFYYPYGNMIGIKIKNECIIYQNKLGGFWTIFTENFADAKCFFYNNIIKKLYLGMSNGILLSYGDKIKDRSYTDYDLFAAIEKKISWRIVYSWISPNTTWHNRAIHFSVMSNKPIVINISVSTNDDETRPHLEMVNINQIGFDFDVAYFGIAAFALQPKEYARRAIDFDCDSFLLEFNGFVEDSFVFNKAHLTGGV